jgi:murein L,D-transpeptidase YafK
MKTRIIVILTVFVFLIAVCSGSPDVAAIKDAKVDRVLLKKSERQLILMTGETVLKNYKVALGRKPVGPKKKEGDNKTPEGSYIIDKHNPKSSFHLSLHISYPSAADRDRAQRDGVHPGGDIMIHGIKNGLGWIGSFHLLRDWTQGCIAVTNEEIEEIYALVSDGTPIELRP